MTNQTLPQTAAQPQPAAPVAPRQPDWRQLDFAADGLVLRSGAASQD